MCDDPLTYSGGAGQLLSEVEAESTDDRCAPGPAIGGRALVRRILPGLLIGASLVFAIREIWLRTDERAICERALQARDWNRLRRVATKWLNHSAKSGDAWMYLALAAEQQGDLVWTAAALSRVPDSHPRVAAALHRHLALAAGPLQRPLEGAESLERLLSLDPRNPAVHRQAITFFAQTFQHARLVEQIRSSIALECEPVEAYVYLAAVDGGRVPVREGLYDRWVATYPDCPLFNAAHTLNLTCHAASKDRASVTGGADLTNASKADARMNAAFSRFPDNTELLAHHIERSMGEGDARQVGRLLDRASARTREDDRFWRYAGWRYGALDEPAQALEACLQAQKLHSLGWKTKRLLAELLRDAGRGDEAADIDRVAAEGEAIHRLTIELEDPARPPRELLQRIADYAAACGDDLVARGAARHLMAME